jgi:transcriptional regulator with XRE-family HTH domain
MRFVSIRRKIFTDDEYRDFAHTLDQARRNQGLSVTDAASVLGITRQTLHLYLNCSGHQPRWRVIERACRAWDVSFVAQGKRWDKGAFGRERPLTTAPEAVQLLLLPEAIERLENASFEVEILRKEPSRIYLGLRVKFSG